MELIDRFNRLYDLQQQYHNELEGLFRDAPRLFLEVRKQHGWTQRKLAELLGVNHTYLSKIENGHIQAGMPTIKKLVELVEQSARRGPGGGRDE